MEFGLLGDVEVRVGGELVDAGHARQRGVLAVLLVEAGRLVPVDVLVDRVWGTRAPHRARNAVAGYVSRLRQVLTDGVRIVGKQGGYVLTADPMSVDLHRFDALVREARSSADALRLLDEALGLWRGEPFSTVDTPWLADVRAAAVARRFAATLDRNDLLLAQGKHAELLAELEATAAAFPLDERVAAQVMLALYRSGRQADALLRYDGIRVRLADELGADPGPELRSLHQGILTADLPLPARLPAAAPFAGRERELAALDALVGRPLVVLTGTAGAGKSALALHWARRVADWFPGGQLHVDLRTSEVSASGERMLVVLDNARDADQVRPLLRRFPRSLVLVTSRDRLTGLVAADGAHPVAVDLLSTEDSRALLALRLGAERLTDTEAVDEIVTRCAGLPLALTAVAARLACGGFEPGEVAAELADGLDAFDGGDSTLRTAFAESCAGLSEEAARLFRLLGLDADEEITAAGAPGTRPLLAELARAHLLIERRPGRYVLHGLLRAYAAELVSGTAWAAGRPDRLCAVRTGSSRSVVGARPRTRRSRR
ncbi:BTAD domain-containing putative transcriptional regulator [Lentzea sp. CA-135723]|uniref:AfsR/SARP family transcriptional regulator n=1 Tax=Lentzea sp. CA-135723 TaxID=3239950 RepID=UPI003D8C6FC1